MNDLRDGPLENLWGAGAGKVQKKYSRKGKLNEKEFMTKLLEAKRRKKASAGE